MWDLRGVAARPVFDGFFWFWVARAFLGFWSCAWAGLRGVTARALFLGLGCVAAHVFFWVACLGALRVWNVMLLGATMLT